MDENTPEVVDTTSQTPDAALVAEDTALPNTDKVAEAIQKARAQEKAKLYPQMEKLQEELAALRSKEQEREAAEAERQAKRLAREAELAAEKKKQEEDEMSFKELLQAKEQEFQAQLEAERQEREKAFALLEREREFQELSQYRQARLESERENIVPELIDLISGNTKDEIEASIADLKARSAKIFESVAAASQQTRKEMVGTRVTVPASGPLDNNSDQLSYSPNDISNMSMADYAKNRQKLLGNSNNRGQGLFGN
jgi:DNA repair exonuclease SbcCD ATPase subunit